MKKTSPSNGEVSFVWGFFECDSRCSGVSWARYYDLGINILSYNQHSMGNGKRETGNGKQEMGNGTWKTGNWKLVMGNGKLEMGNGKR